MRNRKVLLRCHGVQTEKSSLFHHLLLKCTEVLEALQAFEWLSPVQNVQLGLESLAIVTSSTTPLPIKYGT